MAIIYTKKDQGRTITVCDSVPVHSAVAGDTAINRSTGIGYIYTTSWQTVSTADVSAYLPLAGGTMTGLVNLAAGATIASASTVNLTAATGNNLHISGTTAITAFTMNAGQTMALVMDGACQLTYHATTMKLNGGVNYTTAAGDRLMVFKDSANVIHVNIVKQDGTAVVSTATSGWTKVTKTYTDFSTAATTNTITLFTLAAKSVIRGIFIKQTTSFTGGAITAYTAQIGISGTNDKYMDARDIFIAPSDTLPDAAENFVMENWASGTTVQITATSTTANLSAATAGSLDVYYLVETLP